LTALEARAATLTQELGREPEVSELARSVGLDERQVELVRAAIPSPAVLSLDQSVGPSRDERATLADGLADASGDPGMDASEEINDLVKRASERIDRRSQAILRMSYEDGKTLAEIGRSLGVTESRVCQIRTKALRAVREQVRQLCLEDAALGLPVSA
jgi:RNA polymerase sigma factor for flagellar operon FliA